MSKEIEEFYTELPVDYVEDDYVDDFEETLDDYEDYYDFIQELLEDGYTVS